MSQSTTTNYSCDSCGKKLNTFQNKLNIVTSKNESSIGWRRLHIRILEVSGAHNDAKIRDADLCRSCAMNLLHDALKRVQGGERATAGVEEIKEQGWK